MKSQEKELFKFIMNFIFAIYNCVIGIVSYSWWFIAVGAYYIVLSVMRITVISYKSRKNEKFIMRFSGAMLFFLSVILSGIVYMTINHSVAVKYHEIVMITIALYAFIKIGVAIYKFIKSGKHERPYIKTLNSIALTDAVVSIYSLQRSMLVSFEGMTDENIIIFNTLSGIAMCIITVCTGINLVIRKEE